jgi:hypothetical protein
MIRRRRHEMVETQADLVLADELAAAAYEDHFEAQMHPGRIVERPSVARVLRRIGKILKAILVLLPGG